MKNKRKTRIVAIPIKEQSASINVVKELGKYLLDISKLVTGGGVITIALQLNEDKYGLMLYAVILALIFAASGFIVLTYKKQ